MKYFLDYILHQIITHEDDFDICQTEEEENVYSFKISVHEDDMPRVIGHHGHTINSIRNLMNTAASKSGMSVRVKVLKNISKTLPA